MSDLTTRTAAAAGAWWAQRLMVEGKRVEFANEVARLVGDALQERPTVYTECDYDPKGLLLEALLAVGIECRGFMNSARGILPQKHELEIAPGRLVPI